MGGREGRRRVSCAEQVGEAFQADSNSRAAGPKAKWGAWQGSSSIRTVYVGRIPWLWIGDPLEGTGESAATRRGGRIRRC